MIEGEMKMKKIIWLACGSGVASSQMAAHTLGDKCKERGLDVEIVVVGFRDIGARHQKPDVMVSIAPGIETGKYADLKDVPVINGVALLTGMGIEGIMDEIEQALKE
jgi:PTS system galactitol-specific IIB component